MPWFSLHRTHMMSTTTGHVLNFKKGETTWVPDACVPAAIAIGAIPSVPLDVELDPLKPEAPPPTAALTPAEREAKYFAAFAEIKSRGKRDDFLASGMPHLKKTEELTGFPVSAAERDEMWQKYQESKDPPEVV